MNEGDKAIVVQEAWSVCKEALMEHEKNCPVKKAIDIKKAHLVGFGLGIALVSSIGSGTFTFILLKILKVIGG